jgi:hypothetical protein
MAVSPISGVAPPPPPVRSPAAPLDGCTKITRANGIVRDDLYNDRGAAFEIECTILPRRGSRCLSCCLEQKRIAKLNELRVKPGATIQLIHTEGSVDVLSKALLVLCATLFVPGASALETARERANREVPLFAKPHITMNQWNATHAAAVKSARSVSREAWGGNEIEAVRVGPTQVLYFVTRGPAFPALARFTVYAGADGAFVRAEGHFVGDERPFAKWFASLGEKVEAVKKELQQENPNR